MSEPKIKPSDLKREATKLIRRGQLPSLETLLTAIAEAREKFGEEIIQARRGPCVKIPRPRP